MFTYKFLELLAAEYKSSDIELLSDQIKAMLEKGLISEEDKDETITTDVVEVFKVAQASLAWSEL